MSLFNFGREQLQQGMLNKMLAEVGIDDVGSFVQDFRSQANHEAAAQHHERNDDEDDEDTSFRHAPHQEAFAQRYGRNDEDEDENEDEDTSLRHASNQQENLFSMGKSLFNKFSGSRGGGGRDEGANDSSDMIQGAMKAYKMFSGSQGSSGSGGGNFLDNISSTYENAQKMYAIYKQFDKNGDGKITAADIEIYFQEMGLGFISPYLAKGLFQAVDQNHNGSLDFTDLMALSAILNKLSGKFGGASAANV